MNKKQLNAIEIRWKQAIGPEWEDGDTLTGYVARIDSAKHAALHHDIPALITYVRQLEAKLERKKPTT